MDDIYIISGARTAIGTFGGSLAGFRPADLGSLVMKEAIARAGITPQQVENVVVGTVVPTQPKDAYVSRVAAVNAGIPIETPAMNVNRLCGSGLQAIVSAAQAIALGEHKLAIGAGAEVMSGALRVMQGTRNGQKMGDLTLEDMMLGALHDPFEGIHMGVTAENVAERCGISREQQDQVAAESHRRAAAAIAAGYFKDQIVPVEIKTRKGVTVFDTDEHVRAEATAESMAGLKPVFKKDGTVTAGNASGINDGAAAVVLASGAAVAEQGLKPMAKILAWGHAGVEPSVMGLGPVKAVPVALQRAGLSLDQIDVIESNEAFAAQACGVAKELGFDPAKTNPNGSGISLGHPIGATGAILTIKAVYELHRTGGRYGLITMCIGGGQGIAMVVERVLTVQLGRMNRIGVATPDLDASIAFYRDVMGATDITEPFVLESQQVRVCFVNTPGEGGTAGTQVELLQPTSPDSAVGKWLEKNPLGGQHHICYEVPDIHAAKAWFEGLGKRVLGEPRIGAHGTLIFFVHPKDMGGQLTEIMETPEERIEAVVPGSTRDRWPNPTGLASTRPAVPDQVRDDDEGNQG